MQSVVETCQGSERCVTKIQVFFLPGNGERREHERGQEIVLFFGGDDIGSTALACHPDIRRLSDPRTIGELLGRTFSLASCVVIVAPSRFEGGYACYDHFVEYDRWDISGMHIKERGSCQSGQWVYTSKTYKALKHLYGILSNATSMSGAIKGCRSWKLVGFSKGGIVINQILTEIADLHMRLQSSIDGMKMECDTEFVAFCYKLSQVHYVDVGLPHPGAYIWDTVVMKGLADFLSTNDPSIQGHFIVIHGTLRQFGIHNPAATRLIDEMLAMVGLSVQYSIPLHIHLYNVDEENAQLLHYRLRRVPCDTQNRFSFHDCPPCNEEGIDQNSKIVAEHCRCLEYMYLHN